MKSSLQVLACKLPSRNAAVCAKWRLRAIEKAFWPLQQSALALLNYPLSNCSLPRITTIWTKISGIPRKGQFPYSSTAAKTGGRNLTQEAEVLRDLSGKANQDLDLRCQADSVKLMFCCAELPQR